MKVRGPGVSRGLSTEGAVPGVHPNRVSEGRALSRLALLATPGSSPGQALSSRRERRRRKAPRDRSRTAYCSHVVGALAVIVEVEAFALVVDRRAQADDHVDHL